MFPQSIDSLQLPSALARIQLASKALPFLAYIAQVTPPPINSKRIGMNAVMKSFRFCGNSLSYITAFNLHLVGGPKLPDLRGYLASCGMRAAYKTLVGYNEQHNELLRLAVGELPLAIHNYKACTPSGWDSPALCTNLFLFASHNVCSGLADPGLPRVRNVQAYLYKKLSERMPDPFIAWGKLSKDGVSFFY